MVSRRVLESRGELTEFKQKTTEEEERVLGKAKISRVPNPAENVKIMKNLFTYSPPSELSVRVYRTTGLRKGGCSGTFYSVFIGGRKGSPK